MEDSQVVQNYLKIRNSLPENVDFVVVSKHQSVEAIKQIYDAGQRIFGENRVQELLEKKAQLPADIEWHFIGNLQSNKVKYIAPFVSLIHSVSSPHLLEEIDKQAKKNERVINCLIEVHIADEESKQGYGLQAADELLKTLPRRAGVLQNDEHVAGVSGVSVIGLMGMATNTTDEKQVRKEFNALFRVYEKYKDNPGLRFLSMGMTGDYPIAIEEGSNMIRIGTLIFGLRK